MASRPKSPPVICTDDAWFMIAAEPPLTMETIKEKMLSLYEGTPAALWWAIGDHEVYHHETRVGEIFGEGYEEIDPTLYHSMHSGHPGAAQMTFENIRHLMKSDGGPLTALVALCRQAGMEFFPRVRMNSHYPIDPSSPSYGRFRTENPELLIGRPDETIPEGTVESGIRTGLNYALPRVREYMCSIITELFERFDVDGVELDFMRHPAFFRTEEAFQNGYLMTDLVRSVRERMTEVGSSRGRTIRLGVRVPPTLADSRRVGVDVAEWIAEGLVDVVVVGGGFIPFETPVDEFVAAAQGTDTQVYGCIEALRHIDEPAISALASSYWKGGASGVYLYSFFTMPADWNRRVLNQISDPKALERVDKRYWLDQTGPITPCGTFGCAFRYASPSAQLPVTLRENFSGEGPVLRFQITDDLEAASADGSLRKCTLLLKLDDLGPACHLDARLNGTALPWSSSHVSLDGWSKWIRSPTAEHTISPSYPVEAPQPGVVVEYDIGPPTLRQGQNQLEVHLVADRPGQAPPVVLDGVDVTVNYRS